MAYSVPLSRRGKPWFDDGNIILLAETDDSEPAGYFKVHRGILARQSEMFAAMFDIPQSDDVETLDNCPVVRMYDVPTELANLITAIYDPVVFQNRNVEDFFFLAGILRLATKYFISRLRTQAIRSLTQTWAYTIRGHDEMVSLALSSPIVDGTTYPYVHPLHVLNLAREVNIRIVVPSALYFLSIYSLDSILRGDHPKLTVKHPSRPSSQLALHDVSDYTLMYQHRINVILDFIRHTCGERVIGEHCQSPPKQCARVFSRLTANIHQSFTPRTGPFHNMGQAMQWIDDDVSICGPCQRAFRRDVTDLREKLWDELPSVVGLPSWSDLLAMDLPPSSS
ncbi:hypothetical protein FA95DRAFT_1485982 [Auriscalpium vulgare]|uniref:Uncharacterized protein n=1 Tax=Auriscalpium vulgare TaxID=40419 RepID=A0ACB8S3P6_9AGAM|nr:hypothetical protein FA95DRAFT_1485982 [Auriscalpium vulgare]